MGSPVNHRFRFIAGLLLAIFFLEAAQGAFCCDLDDGSTGMTSSSSMPCHQDDGSDQDSGCCLLCVVMASVVELPVLDSGLQASAFVIPLTLDVLIRPSPPYRPPIHLPS